MKLKSDSLQKVFTANFLYGTAWKKKRTAEFTCLALEMGFPGIDTANQPLHNDEEAAGAGIKKYMQLSGKKRDEIFIQSKFTYPQGHGHRAPYDINLTPSEQLIASFSSSLEHLQTDYLDSYFLHGPNQVNQMNEMDFEVWRSMEDLFEAKKILYLGVANVSLSQLKHLCENVKVKPTFVQNRCVAHSAWDKEVRDYCTANNIFYQGFSILTANLIELVSPLLNVIADKYHKKTTQIVFRYCRQLKIISLIGSASLVHLKEDMDIDDFELSQFEMNEIENIADRWKLVRHVKAES